MAGSVKVVLKSVYDDKGIKEAQKSFGSIGKSIGGIAKGAVAAFAAVGAGAAFTSVIQGASNLEQQLGALKAVFGTRAGEVQEFAESMQGFGLSTAEAAQSASLLGSQLLGLGLSQDEAIGKTKDLQVLAADLAATYGGTTTEAVSALSAVFRGEYNQVERYGVALRKSDINAQLAAQGMAGLTGEALKQAEAQAALGLIFDKTTVAQGQATREANTFAGQMGELQATFKNVRDEIGMELLPVIVDLIQELKPLVSQLAPILSKLLTALSPIIVTLARNIGPLFEALDPVIEAFLLLIDAAAEIIEQILPPLIEVFAALAPVVLQVVKAILPLIMDLLPPLIKLFDALMPVLMILVDYWTNFLIPIFTDLGEFLSFTLIGVIEALADGFNFLASVLGPLYAAIKPVLDAILQFMGIDPSELKKQIVVDVKVNDAELKKFEKVKFTGTGGTLDFLQGMGMGGVSKAPVTTQTTTTTGGGGGTAKDNSKAIAQATKDASAAIKKAQKDYGDTVKKARSTYAKAVTDANADFAEASARALEARNTGLAEATKANTEAVAQINKDFTAKLAGIVKDSINRLRDAYRSAVAIDVGSLFDTDSVGRSVDGLVNTLKDKLAASRRLLQNASELSARGFSQTFIEQVVGAGTETGNELAESILNATPETQSELQGLFRALEVESQTGMDALSQQIYDGAGLATDALKQLYSDTLGEQNQALTDQAAAYAQQQADILSQFDLAMIEAGDIRDTALENAMKEYNEALKKAAADFLLELDEIEKKFKAKLKELGAQKAQIDKLQAEIDAAKKIVPVVVKNTPIVPVIPVGGGDGKGGNVINLNVQTDSTQSTTQVGKVIAQAVSKYVNAGGQTTIAVGTGRIGL